MKEILATLFLLSVIYFFTVHYFIPKRKIQTIAAQFRAKGYRVFVYPYKPLSSAFFTQVAKDTLKGDAQKTIKE